MIALLAPPTILAVVFGVFGTMIGEAVLAQRHEREQFAKGGLEPTGDVYQVMRVAYPCLFLLMIGEGMLAGSPSSAIVGSGAAVFALAKALKWWAILSLGLFWTFRVIVVPGATLVASGPYRFLRHPNYVAVLGEFVGVALMTGARITGPIGIVVFGALMLKRIAVEERALRRR